jgi:hypothetical protein
MTPRMRVLSARSAALAALLLLAATCPATAQSLGRGLGRPRSTAPARRPGETLIPGRGVRQFGTWLDDATVLGEGKGWTTIGAGYSRALFGHQWDAPSVDAGIGLGKHLQIAVNAPFSRVAYTDGSSLRGLGDAYVVAKIGLVDPEASGRTFGIALAPMLEVLSSGSVRVGEKRAYWALPVMFERRFSTLRVYGTAGYFSRGAAFGSGALELPLSSKVAVTGAVSHTRSVHSDPLSDARRLSPRRWDITGSATCALTSKATLFGSVGRTVSPLDENGSSLTLGAGLSLGFERVVRH